MQVPRTALLFALVAPAGVAWPNAAAELLVDAGPATASIEPQGDGRRLVRLPALEFRFDIRAECDPARELTSVSISVADTRKTLGAADLPDAVPVAASIELPARQIAPVAVDDFCPETQGESSSLLIQDVVTAQLSLRCAGPDGDSMTYVSRPLAVTLLCSVDPALQGSEPASTDR